MSPHAAKARGIFDRGAVAPIGGHEGMPEDSSQQRLLEDQGLMGSAQPVDEDNEGLISELSLFDAGAASEGDGGGGGPGDEDLAMAWPGSRLVRSASMSSTGSGDAEESEVQTRCSVGNQVHSSTTGHIYNRRQAVAFFQIRNFYCFFTQTNVFWYRISFVPIDLVLFHRPYGGAFAIN